jgi:high-affinity nickel-transport protein
MALALVALGSQFTPPAWLGPVGTMISAGTLIALGAINVRAAFGAEGAGAPFGLRSRFMAPLLRASGPWQIALVGALFAVSFDSVAIATLLASAGGMARVLETGSAFSAGMLVVGVANGLWVARLLCHSSESSQRAARVMTLTIALIAFAVAARVVLPLLSAEWDRWIGEYELVASASVITLVLAGYVTSLRVGGRSRPAQDAPLASTPDIVS